MKKGFTIAPEVLVGIILAVVAGSVIMFFLVGIKEKGCPPEVHSCRTGVLASALVAKASVDIPAACPSDSLTFDSSYSPIEMAEVLAKKVELCAYKFGGGLDVVSTNPNWITSDVDCYICTRIHFEDNALKSFLDSGVDLKKMMGGVNAQCTKGKTVKQYVDKVNSETSMFVLTGKGFFNKNQNDYVVWSLVGKGAGVYNLPESLARYIGAPAGSTKTQGVLLTEGKDIAVFGKCEVLFQ